jgi:phospholipase A-2-activating protein
MVHIFRQGKKPGEIKMVKNGDIAEAHEVGSDSMPPSCVFSYFPAS